MCCGHWSHAAPLPPGCEAACSPAHCRPAQVCPTLVVAPTDPLVGGLVAAWGLPGAPMNSRATQTLPEVQPILLTPRRDPFNDPAWLFEPKFDGYRGLLYVTRKGCWFRSKRGNVLRRFDQLCYWVREELPVKEAILDGEVVALDTEGRQNFRHLLTGRGN